MSMIELLKLGTPIITDITSIGALIYTVRSFKTTTSHNNRIAELNERQIKANLVSKSRLEWLDQVRPLMAKYINDFDLYKNDILDAITQIQNADPEDINKIILLQNEKIETGYFKLRFFLSEKDSNPKLFDSVKEIYDSRNYLYEIAGTYIDVDFLTNYDEFLKIITNLNDIYKRANINASEYFKEEWERIKNCE